VNARISVLILLLAAAVMQNAAAWESHQFDLPSQAPEAQWRDALMEKLGGQHEVRVEGGRIDVMTDTEVYELDWPHKWHEGLGQALHYADATGKKPMLALISYSQGEDNLQPASIERFNMVERICAKQGVKLVILFPTQPKAYGATTNQVAEAAQSTNYWLNTKTGMRHHIGCRFYGKGLEGRPCGSDEGKPCSICGK
jgi:hypothetical protein